MSTQTKFSDQELDLLKRIARGIIPPSPERGLPGADDDLIFSRLLVSVAEQSDQLQGELHDLLSTKGGLPVFGNCDDARFAEWISNWAECWPGRSHPFFKAFMPMLLRAYYQDPRVHSAYDRRPGAPYPDGYVIIEGDWSLLDQVRGRSPFYRQ